MALPRGRLPQLRPEPDGSPMRSSGRDGTLAVRRSQRNTRGATALDSPAVGNAELGGAPGQESIQRQASACVSTTRTWWLGT